MAYGVPFQSPPSRQSVAALLSRLSASGQSVPGMATGGAPAKPALPTFTAPQNASVATPFTGDITHYGEGPEHDFFVDPAPPPPPPPKPTGGTGGGGGGGNNQFPFGGDGSGSRNPWNQGTGGTGTGTGGSGQPPPSGTTPAFANVAFSSPAGQNFLNVLQQHGIAAPPPQPALTSAAQKDAAFNASYFGAPAPAGPAQPKGLANPTFANSALGQTLIAHGATVPPPPAPAPTPPAKTPIQQTVAQKLGLAPASKPSVMTAQPAAAQPKGGTGLSAYLNNLKGYQTTGSGSPRNMATGGQPEDPSEVVAAPQQNVQNIQGGDQSEGRQSDQGAGLSARDQMNADVAVNPSLKNAISIGSMVAGLATAPLTGLAMTAGKLAINALTGDPITNPFDTPGPRLTADQQQAAIDASNAAVGPVTNQRAAYMDSIRDSRTIDRGGQIGGVGPGLSAGTGVDSAGHSYGSNIGGGGVSHNLAGGNGNPGGGGGIASAGGSGRGDYGGSGEPDKGGLYRRGGGVRNYAKGGMPRFPSIRRFDDGGSYVIDPASDPTVDSIDPSTTDATAQGGSSGGFDTKWLPMLAGAFGAKTGDPYAGAASIGVATQLLGGTPQDAMDAARLLYKSGASQQPKAQKQDFDPSRSSTNSLLAALAQQGGVANKLRMAQLDPTTSMTSAPQPYQKPAARGSTVSKATGGLVQGGEPHGVRSDGTSFAVKGAGDGQSDDINAKLSNNEHVWDSGTVAMLGNGDSDSGHKRLDEMRVLIRKNAGMKNPKKIIGKQPSVADLLRKVSGGRK